MAGKIKKTDVIDEKAIIKALDNVGKAFNDVSDDILKVAESSKKLNESFKQSENTQKNTASRQQQLSGNLDTLAKKEQELVKIKEQTSKTIARASAERSKENKELIKAQQARAEQNKKLKEAIRLQGAETDSIAKLKAENARLRKERDKVNTSTDKGRAKIQQLNTQIDKNTAKIKGASDAYVQQKMNIGNYSSALAGVPGPVGAAGSSMQRFTAILKANPIVLIITAIVGALKLFKNILGGNQKAIDKFKSATKGLGARLAVLKDRINEVVNGERKLKDAFKGAGEEMREEARQAKELEKRRQTLRDAQIAFIETEAEMEKQIQQNRLLAKDQTKSNAERLAFLQEAVKVENELTKQRVEFAKENAAIITAETEMGMSTAEEIKAAAEARAEATRVQTDSYKMQQRLVSELTGFEKQLLAEQKKTNAEIEKIDTAGLEIKYDNRLMTMQQAAVNEQEVARANAELIAEIELEIEKEKQDKIKALRQEQAMAGLEVAGQAAEAGLMIFESAKNRELEKAGDNEKKREEIEEKFAKKQKALLIAQAVADKLNALFQIKISTAAAIAKALPNPVLVGFAKALGILQAVTVAAAPIPQFWKGVKDFGGGVADVGERGKELIETPDGVFLSPDRRTRMYLPPGTNVIPNPETEKRIEQNSELKELAESNKALAKSIQNRPEQHTQLTEGGLKYFTKKNNSTTEYLNRYFKS